MSERVLTDQELEEIAFQEQFLLFCDMDEFNDIARVIEQVVCKKLEQQLAAALAACKLKDAALIAIVPNDSNIGKEWRIASEALAIQPDDYALMAWLGEPVAWRCNGELYEVLQLHLKDDSVIAGQKPLYSPKGLK